MAAHAGRDGVFIWNSVAQAGIRQMGISFAAEGIDIEDKDDDGIRRVLTGYSAMQAIDLSVEGVWRLQTLRTRALNPSQDKLIDDVEIQFADGGTLTGDFFLSNYSESYPYKEAVTWTASLLSSGLWIYTPAT